MPHFVLDAHCRVPLALVPPGGLIVVLRRPGHGVGGESEFREGGEEDELVDRVPAVPAQRPRGVRHRDHLRETETRLTV